MRPNRSRVRLLLTSALVLALSAGPGLAQDDHADPWQPMNRKLYGLHQVLDRLVFAPAAHAYGWLPSPIRAGLHNFSQNLGEPLVFVNDLLQGHVGTAASTLGRFAINTTVGVAGVLDVAARGRIPHHDNGFGTTLGRWGVAPGPYLFLPLLGPSDVRDAFGGIVNVFLSPQYYANYPARHVVSPATVATTGLQARLDAQQVLDTVEETSTDPYATLRSFFLQSRSADIHGATNPEALPEFDNPDAPQPQPQAEPQPSPPEPAAPTPAAEPAPKPDEGPSAPAPAPPPASPAPPGGAPEPVR